MKNKLLSAFSLLLLCTAHAQSSVALFLSNNGQAAAITSRFYYIGEETVYLDDSNQGNDVLFMPGISYSYRTSTCEFGFRIARASLRHQYNKITPVESWEVTDKQYDWGFGLRAMRVWSSAPFSFGIGGEIPVHMVSDFTQDAHSVYRPDSVNIALETRSTTVMDGGFLLGLNMCVSADWNMNKTFYLRAMASYGIMNAKLGGEYTTVYSYTSQPGNNDVKLKKTYGAFLMPAPEVIFGFGIHL